MGAIIDILRSERGLIGVALIVCATVLTGMKLLTEEQWSEYTRFIFAVYVGGKSITGAAAYFAAPKSATAPAAPDSSIKQVRITDPELKRAIIMAAEREPAAKLPPVTPAGDADKVPA